MKKNTVKTFAAAVFGKPISCSAYDSAESNREKVSQLRQLFYKYKSMPVKGINEALAEDINSFLSSENMRDVIVFPKKYIYGEALREAYIKNMELFYAISCENKNFDTRDRLFELVYELHAGIDSVHIQHSLVRHFESFYFAKSEQETADKLFDIMEFYFKRNHAKIKRIRSSREGKANEKLIAAHQSIMKVLLLNNRERRPTSPNKLSYERNLLKEIVGEEKYGEFASQIFSREYMDIYKMYSGTLLDKFVGKKEKPEFVKFASSAQSLVEVLGYITKKGIFYGTGCYLIASNRNPKEIYSVLKSETTDIRFRLYALKTLAQMDYDEKGIMFYINNQGTLSNIILKILASSDSNSMKSEMDSLAELRRKNTDTKLLSSDEISALARAAEAIIRDKSSAYSKNPFANNIESEILIISLILAAASMENSDVDVVKSLKKMPAVMSFNAENGYELLSDFHGFLILQDVSEKNKALEYFIENMSSFLNSDKNLQEDIINQLKIQFFH